MASEPRTIKGPCFDECERGIHWNRTPSRFWERVESNPLVQALIVLCLAAVVAAQIR